jgi:hypothetical protein
MLASKSSSLPSNLRSLMNKKTQCKVALKRYLNTHSFYSVEESLTFKNYSQYVQKFFLLFVVWTLYNIFTLYVKHFLCYLYSIFKKYLSVVSSFWLCCFCFVVAAFIGMFYIFMTYSTSYCYHCKLKDPWNVCIYACMYVCTCVCVCACACARACVGMYTAVLKIHYLNTQSKQDKVPNL